MNVAATTRASPTLTSDGGGRLQPFVAVHEPQDSRSTPPTLAFRRKRDVEIPWKEILDQARTTGDTSVAAIREYFERSWGLESVTGSDLPALSGGPAPRIRGLAAGTRPGSRCIARTSMLRPSRRPRPSPRAS
jgi:hypothetical protein